MTGIIVSAKVILLTFVVSQGCILLLRLSSCGSKIELFWFALALFSIAVYNLVRNLMPTVAPFLLLWALGSYIVFITVRKTLKYWVLALIAAILIFFLSTVLGYYGTLPFTFLYVFVLILLSSYPVKLLIDFYRRFRSGSLLFFVLAVSLLYLASGYDFIAHSIQRGQMAASLWASLLFLAVSGYMLVQEDYLQSLSRNSFYERYGQQQRKLRSVYARLIQTEHTLLLQDRLIATGILAAGATHEFKNTLGAIQTTAEYGLRQESAAVKDRALSLVIEHTELGKKAVEQHLDQIIREGREEPLRLKLKEELKTLLDLLRTALRRDRVSILVEIDPAVQVMVRKGELEQILLNLVRNALDSLGAVENPADRQIVIRGRLVEDQVVLDVIDHAGGIPPELCSRIFEAGVSGREGTGLGLYLARMLVSRNNGRIEYIPVDGGSCFRLVFPSC